MDKSKNLRKEKKLLTQIEYCLSLIKFFDIKVKQFFLRTTEAKSKAPKSETICFQMLIAKK
jgi:hypothetical protein